MASLFVVTLTNRLEKRVQGVGFRSERGAEQCLNRDPRQAGTRITTVNRLWNVEQPRVDTREHRLERIRGLEPHTGCAGHEIAGLVTSGKEEQGTAVHER